MEQLVGAIQETIKDCPEIIVRTNAKITNDIGIQREIDVLVQNDTIMESFECKDYAQSKNRRAVDVQVVDGVIGKNKYLSQINKLNIVSTTGYTSSAKKEAAVYGIQLYTMDDVKSDNILFDGCAYYAETLFEIKDVQLKAYSKNKEILFVGKLANYDEFLAPYLENMNDEEYNSICTEFIQNKRKPFVREFCFKPDLLFIQVCGKYFIIDEIIVSAVVNLEMKKGRLVKQKKIEMDKTVYVAEYAFPRIKSSTFVIKGNDDRCHYYKQNNGIMSPFEIQGN